jgi:tetratricopeptide (TPR) repeat protein
VQALLAARLEALPDDERDLLERASVIGHDFEWEALGELSADRRRPPGAVLSALVRKELIRPHEGIGDTFRFRHILIRDAAYERISKELRAELHERFAGWLEGRGEEFEEIVGYHLEQAHHCLTDLAPSGARADTLGERASKHLASSGRRAYARSDVRAAASLLERAAALLTPDDSRRIGLLPDLGRALCEAGQPHRAEEVLAQAVDAAHVTGYEAVAVDAAVALATVRLHIDLRVGQSEVWRELRDAIPFYERSGDEAGLARALGVSGNLRYWRGETEGAIEDHVRAAHHARNAGEWAQEAESLQGVLLAMLFGPTPVEDALERIDEIAPIDERNRPLKVHVLRVRAQLEAMRGQFATARDQVEQAFALAEELGLELTLARVAMQAGPVELLAGDPVAAERRLRPAYEALERMKHWGYLSSTLPLLVDALLEQGRVDDALPLTELGRDLSVNEDIDAQVGWRRARGKVLARLGEPDEAEGLAREAVELADRTEYLNLRAQAHADLAEVMRAAGKNEEAAAALAEAIRLYEQKGNTAAIRLLTAEQVERGPS